MFGVELGGSDSSDWASDGLCLGINGAAFEDVTVPGCAYRWEVDAGGYWAVKAILGKCTEAVRGRVREWESAGAGGARSVELLKDTGNGCGGYCNHLCCLLFCVKGQTIPPSSIGWVGMARR